MSRFIHYLERYALVSLEKQDRLMSLIGDNMHELDLDAGKVRFSDSEFSMQVIGTESDNTLTWLWAWADEQTEIPEVLLDASRQLQDWGRSEDVPEFTAPSVDLNAADGHTVSLIASQVCNASGFFRDDYEGGAAFLLLFDNRIDALPSFDRARLLRGLRELFTRYELNHRNVILAYLQLKGLPLSEEGSLINCSLLSREPMRFEFHSSGTLLSVDGVPFSLS